MINKKWCLIFFSMLFVLMNTNSFAENSADTKKIVSVVYDDSGSMGDNDNYCYADYALQILTASLSKNDELNIVKMSRWSANNEINLTDDVKRQSFIDDIKKYSHNGGTPFQSVDTARDWLIKKKNDNKEGAKYWLIVITDGSFGGGYNYEEYMKKINEEFNNYNFEFVFLSIGYNADADFSKAVSNSVSSTVIEAKDRESIYTALMEISKMINGGASDKFVDIEKKSNKVIKLVSEFPLKSLMILSQNDGNSVQNVKFNNKKMTISSFDVSYDYKNLKGNFAHVLNGSSEYLPDGEYIIEFSKEVELKNITFLCEAFVEAEIKLVDENDNELNNVRKKVLLANDKVNVKCELYNAANGSKIIDSAVIKALNVNLVNGKNSYKMKYNADKQAFYIELGLLAGNNNLYAIVEADEMFRVKTNVINIDTDAGKMNMEYYKKNQAEIEVPYSASSDYKTVTNFVFEFIDEGQPNIAEDFELQLMDLPKGIKFEYEGKKYGDMDKIPMVKELDKQYVLDIMANKNYVDELGTEITLKIYSKDNNVYWSESGLDEYYIKLIPKKYPIKIFNKDNNTEIDINEETLKLKVYKMLSEDSSLIQGEVNVEGIKKIETDSKYFSGITYSVAKNKDDNTLDVKFKANILALFGDKKVDVKIKAYINNGVESGEYLENITIVNINIMEILMPYIVGAVILIILLGYVVKNKFNKKAQITIVEGSSRNDYSLKPTLKTLIIPYISHRMKVDAIEFRAGKGCDIVFSARGLNIQKIDDENYDEYIEINRVNVEKLTMKKDVSSVVIDNFGVVQRYEYVSKEVDFSDYDDQEYENNYSDYDDEY